MSDKSPFTTYVSGKGTPYLLAGRKNGAGILVHPSFQSFLHWPAMVYRVRVFCAGNADLASKAGAETAKVLRESNKTTTVSRKSEPQITLHGDRVSLVYVCRVSIVDGKYLTIRQDVRDFCDYLATVLAFPHTTKDLDDQIDQFAKTVEKGLSTYDHAHDVPVGEPLPITFLKPKNAQPSKIDDVEAFLSKYKDTGGDEA